jgi:hypothetical protein
MNNPGRLDLLTAAAAAQKGKSVTDPVFDEA